LLRYRLPRLRGRGHGLSQPGWVASEREDRGETQARVDAADWCAGCIVEADLRAVDKTRTLHEHRVSEDDVEMALVGYNAGQSTS